MPTIDLSTPPPPSTSLLDGLPRRVALTLAELRVVADHAGDAPLPFDLTLPEAAAVSTLEDRLGQSRGGTENDAYAAALAAQHDPTVSLERRGLLVDGRADPGLTGALGLLATPTLALDLDVVVRGVHAKAWHRQSGPAVATLSTIDGLVFELAWLPVAQWSDELARVAVPPERRDRPDAGPEPVPPWLDLPFELLDAAAEAVRTDRPDLVDVLVTRYRGEVRGPDRVPLPDAAVAPLLHALVGHDEGRLRGLVADVSGAVTAVVGVASWTLLPDGWRALRPRGGADGGSGIEGGSGGGLRVEVVAVSPDDLGSELSPVLAEVVAVPR